MSMVGSAQSLLTVVQNCPRGQSTLLWHCGRQIWSAPQTSGMVQSLVYEHVLLSGGWQLFPTPAVAGMQRWPAGQSFDSTHCCTQKPWIQTRAPEQSLARTQRGVVF
jgi:hypothetical protein